MDSLECTGTTVVRPSGCRRKRWLPFALCAANPALLMNANKIKLLNIPFLSSEAKLNSFNLVFAGSLTATGQRLSGGFREPPCRLSCFPIRANVSIANRGYRTWYALVATFPLGMAALSRHRMAAVSVHACTSILAAPPANGPTLAGPAAIRLQFAALDCICTGMRGTGKPWELRVSAITRLVSKYTCQ